ncbi:sialic acid-binding Ig-like lectin 16 [Otolemur garnettii]|uniref:sialic acid-binding Ig-like lectin 16 n=1 Tax=Otolemur garnettii TaxID=30611 RepID=UPI000C7EF0B1|nr:sialic acid-binding Ig-like lectin 16 [Otolemur garnettii]
MPRLTQSGHPGLGHVPIAPALLLPPQKGEVRRGVLAEHGRSLRFLFCERALSLPQACCKSFLPRWGCPGARQSQGSHSHWELRMLLLFLLLSMLGAGSLKEDPDYHIQVQKSVSVQEGVCVFIPCTFSYPQNGWTESTPAYGYWFEERSHSTTGAPVATNNLNRKVQGRVHGRFEFRGRPQNKDCSLVIREAKKLDTGYYYFRVERGSHVNHNFRRAFFLVVTGPAISSQGTRPQPSHVSMLNLMLRLQDHDTDLTCQVSFSTGGLSTQTIGLSVLPRLKAGDSGRYTCLAENNLGSQQRSLELSVQYPPENLTVIVFQANRTVLEILRNDTSLPVLEGQSLRLVCVTLSNPPARLNWAWKSRILSLSQFSDPGVLELPRVQMEHEGEFTCHAQHPLGSQHFSLSLSVHSKSASSHFFMGKLKPGAEVALVAMGESAVKILLLCLCLILLSPGLFPQSEVPQEAGGSGSTGCGGCRHCHTLIPQMLPPLVPTWCEWPHFPPLLGKEVPTPQAGQEAWQGLSPGGLCLWVIQK